jgi:hypothetical protein
MRVIHSGFAMLTVFGVSLLPRLCLAQHEHEDASRGGHLNYPIVQFVRRATAPFQDVKEAEAAGYAPGTPCVSGPNEGAMGIHYVNGSLLGDGAIDPAHPEALIYEPQANGRLRLVGVEYLTLASAWDANNVGPPQLLGNLFNLVGKPNRYRIDDGFYELHVWAWRPNPNGTFADWNEKVTCAAAPIN